MKIGLSVLTTGARSAHLAACVEAIDRLTPAPEVTLDLVLVHNGVPAPDPALESLAATLRTPTSVIAEPRRGIPFARNRALDHAIACGFDYLAFIDDDARPDPDWLVCIVAALRQSGAHAVAGPQVPVFPEGTPARLRRARFFKERREKKNARVNWAASNNVAFAPAFAARHGLRFNETFMTGGSDKEFFLRFHACGGVIVWTTEAIVREPVAPERLSIFYAVLRTWRFGTTGYLIERTRHRPAMAALICCYRGLRYFGRGLLALPMAVAPGNPGLIDGLCDLAHGAGFILGISPRFRIKRYV